MNNRSNRTDGTNGQLIQQESSITAIDLIDNLFYYRWLFLLTFIFVSGIAVLYAFIATPIYTADALIQVEEKKGTSLGALSQVANALGAQQSPVLGEIEIIRSRVVVGRAVDALRANIQIAVENRIPVIGGWISRVLNKDEDGLVEPLWNSERWAWGGEQLSFKICLARG